MAQMIPESFYLLVHDFGGAYAARPATSEGPLPVTEEEALRDLEGVLADWPATKWRAFHCSNLEHEGYGVTILNDVTAPFEEALERRERERTAEPSDPNREHRLTAAQLGVSRYR